MTSSVTLELTQSLLTNGARAVSVLLLQTCYWIAIPQLAKDIPNGQPGMHGGNSNVPLVLYRTNEHTHQLEEFSQVSVAGGEDAELFTIDDRIFLATASVRSGSDPDYNYNIESCIFEWNGHAMEQFQRIPTSGAKQWRAFHIADRHFLALAQGLEEMPGVDGPPKRNSTIYEWDGTGFEPFQVIPSTLGYNWLPFSYSGREFLAHADNSSPSRLMEWNGEKFDDFQTFDGSGGRAFSFFEHKGRAYLAFAHVQSDSLVYRWNDKRFEEFQTLPGQGGRELTLINDGTSSHLVQINFLTGDLNSPQTAINSSVYRIEDDGLHMDTQFPTFGATDAKVFTMKGKTYLIVTESLTQDLRFRQDSHVYRVMPKTPSTSNTRPATGLSKRHQGNIAKREVFTSPEFVSLFSQYAGGSPDSLGMAYRKAFTATTTSDPLLTCSATYMVLYPGDGSDPSYFGFRLETQGFIELTAISHLGPAMASLAQIKVLGQGWQSHARNHLNTTRAVKAANSEALWRDQIKVESYRGREASIAAMINYACDMTIHFLQTVLAEPSKLTPAYVRDYYLQGQTPVVTPNVAPNATSSMSSPSYGSDYSSEQNAPSTWNGTISYNEIMVATFYLGGLDTAYRMQKWLNTHNIDWKRAQVLFNGKAGRQTAGVTLSSNSVAMVIQRSFPDLPMERLYIAPQGPVPDIPANATASELREYEDDFRTLWGSTLGFSHLGSEMFAGFAKYKPAENLYTTIDETTTELSEPPMIMAPDDWFSLITRLRVTLEDPRQTLSAAVADFAAQELFKSGFDLEKVTVSGLDGYDYVSGKRPGGA
ncbi:hypothetical protein N0V90_007694 [Kalmusia sp. IMI 367209]|nr:hypothetical protein N0V90_007694 [Kalmusia sp. IMI 367209]